MDNGPTIIERKALGNLQKVLQKQGEFNEEWHQYIQEYFASWEPIFDSDISLTTYYKTLKNFPRPGKREIIRCVLTGWNKHHSLLTLYECITTLIYLKICDTVEYFFVQQFYNFLGHFMDVCESENQIVIQPKNCKFYTIRFLKEGQISEYGDSYGVIDFVMPSIGEGEDLIIAPWFSLIKSLRGDDKNVKYDQDELSDIAEEHICPLLDNEFVKYHCSWIQSDYDYNINADKFGRYFVVKMHSLRYVDMNGGY